jgi:hypothetical protein
MRSITTALLAILACGTAAEAQVVIGGRYRNGPGGFSGSHGGWGTGYGYGYGLVGGTWSSDGLSADSPYGFYAFARPRRLWMPVSSWVPAPPLTPAPPPSADLAALSMDRDLESGRRLIRLGDYRSALASFRELVGRHPRDGDALAHFAFALALVGEGRNADKALRAAATMPGPLRIPAGDLVKDAREKLRLTGVFEKRSGEGGLSAAWILSRWGDSARLKALSAKDPDAAVLMP